MTKFQPPEGDAFDHLHAQIEQWLRLISTDDRLSPRQRNRMYDILLDVRNFVRALDTEESLQDRINHHRREFTRAVVHGQDPGWPQSEWGIR